MPTSSLPAKIYGQQTDTESTYDDDPYINYRPRSFNPGTAIGSVRAMRRLLGQAVGGVGSEATLITTITPVGSLATRRYGERLCGVSPSNQPFTKRLTKESRAFSIVSIMGSDEHHLRQRRVGLGDIRHWQYKDRRHGSTKTRIFTNAAST